MKVAIIGGGASGLACAAQLGIFSKRAKLPCEVTIFEKNDRVGKKLLSTGNGRCNLANLNAGANDYFESADFVRYAFEKFPVQSNLDFFKLLGLYTNSDEQGRVYPLSNQASGVLDALRFACERGGAFTVCKSEVQKIEKTKGGFSVCGKSFDKVVVAVGGQSAVRDFCGYELLKPFGHSVTKLHPGLVRLTTEQNETKQLKGIRASCRLTLLRGKEQIHAERGELLFGDNVLSGIAAMQLSSFVNRLGAQKGEKLRVLVDFVPDFDFNELLNALFQICKNQSETQSENLLMGFMPKKIGVVILKKCGLTPSVQMKVLTSSKLKEICALCKKYPFEISGTKGFGDSQVTIGGYALRDFDKKTLMSKKVPSLYCCGEALDVDGPCGGYNLSWAWSSARLCAESIIYGR